MLNYKQWLNIKYWVILKLIYTNIDRIINLRLTKYRQYFKLIIGGIFLLLKILSKFEY